MRYEVKTTPSAEGKIVQDLSEIHDSPNYDPLERRGSDMRALISRYVIDTRDAQVRAALIKLGWTPPEAMGAIDIPLLTGGYRRVTASDVLRMERQITQIKDTLKSSKETQ